jgi:hypothetical protein
MAPGRRKLFVDAFSEYQRLLRERPRCLPAADPEDFGLDPEDLGALAAAGFSESLRRMLGTPGAPGAHPSGERGPERWRRVLEAASLWTEGCAVLERGDAGLVLGRFAVAVDEMFEGRVFSLFAVLALAALKRVEEADDRLALLWEWRDEPRTRSPPHTWGSRAGPRPRARGAAGPGPGRSTATRAPAATTRLARLTEQYYYVLLWKGVYDDAQDYVLRTVGCSGWVRLPSGFWTVRAADAFFYWGDTALVCELYERALEVESEHAALREIYLKLADFAYLAGDHASERRLREHYYGCFGE